MSVLHPEKTNAIRKIRKLLTYIEMELTENNPDENFIALQIVQIKDRLVEDFPVTINKELAKTLAKEG